MDPFADVIMVIPANFGEIIEKTKNSATPWREDTLRELFTRNFAENKVAYIMIQTITIVQFYEEEQGEKTASVEPTPPIPGSIPDPTEASSETRPSKPRGGIPRGF